MPKRFTIEIICNDGKSFQLYDPYGFIFKRSDKYSFPCIFDDEEEITDIFNKITAELLLKIGFGHYHRVTVVVLGNKPSVLMCKEILISPARFPESSDYIYENCKFELEVVYPKIAFGDNNDLHE